MDVRVGLWRKLSANWYLIKLTSFCTARSDQISRSVVSDSLQPHESQHARPPCPSPASRVHSSILRCSALFIVQLSRPYMTTGKTIALTRRTFVGKASTNAKTSSSIPYIFKTIVELNLNECIKKQRYYFANKGPPSQGYGFSSGHVWMWELDC